MLRASEQVGEAVNPTPQPCRESDQSFPRAGPIRLIKASLGVNIGMQARWLVGIFEVTKLSVMLS